jgi:hypothetical protein
MLDLAEELALERRGGARWRRWPLAQHGNLFLESTRMRTLILYKRQRIFTREAQRRKWNWAKGSKRRTRLLWRSAVWHGGRWYAGPTTSGSTSQRPNVTIPKRKAKGLLSLKCSFSYSYPMNGHNVIVLFCNQCCRWTLAGGSVWGQFCLHATRALMIDSLRATCLLVLPVSFLDSVPCRQCFGVTSVTIF